MANGNEPWQKTESNIFIQTKTELAKKYLDMNDMNLMALGFKKWCDHWSLNEMSYWFWNEINSNNSIQEQIIIITIIIIIIMAQYLIFASEGKKKQKHSIINYV